MSDIQSDLTNTASNHRYLHKRAKMEVSDKIKNALIGIEKQTKANEYAISTDSLYPHIISLAEVVSILKARGLFDKTEPDHHASEIDRAIAYLCESAVGM